jgi:hypothetical protein
MNSLEKPLIKIFQVFHKTFPYNEKCNWISPIGVNGFKSPGFLSDDTEFNIAELNPHYCELTTLYWIWKNTKSNYVGIYHYRRYFNFIKIDTILPLIKIEASSQGIDYLTNIEQYNNLSELLSFTDVIVPEKIPLLPSIKQQYLNCVEHDPWNVFTKTIKELYPESKNLIDFFDVNSRASMFNMFVMKRPLFDKYCYELFTIINSVYKRIGSPYNEYNNRYPGFLAERFLEIWLMLNKIYSIERPVVHLE